MASQKFKDKNLLFYTPGHQESDYFAKALKSNPALNSQFISIDLRNPNLKIPIQISSINKSLIMILNGCQEPLVDGDAVQWIQGRTSMSNQLDSMNSGSRGFSSAKIAMISQNDNQDITKFASVNSDPGKITTYNEDMTTDAKKSHLQKKSEFYQKERAQFDAATRPVYNPLTKFN